MVDYLWPCIRLGHHTSDPSRKDVVAGMKESSAVHYHVTKCNDPVKELMDRHSKCVVLLVLARSRGSNSCLSYISSVQGLEGWGECLKQL